MKLKKGTFYLCKSQLDGQKQEIPEYIVKTSTIYVDSVKAAMVDARNLLLPMGKGIISERDIKGELDDVVTGELGRGDDEEIILFKTVGFAIQKSLVKYV